VTVKAAPACTLVIFGARGDLTKRLLVPALYNLAVAGLLPPGFKLVGVDHGQCDDAGLRMQLGDFLHSLAADKNSEFGAAKIDDQAWSWLADRMTYLIGDFEDPVAFARLAEKLGPTESVLFYLATAPRFFGEIVDQIGKAGLARQPKGGFRRVVIEKPFGDDLATARALNRRILKVLDESQIYRIDHFLGKETVRNILVTRFGNGVFEPLWNRRHIDWVEITAAETVGVESRGGYYDKAGALRDMVPNHLFQVLAMVAMEPPNSFDADAVRSKKTEVLEAIKPLDEAQALKDAVRGQYDAGVLLNQRVQAYREEPDVARDSATETYVAWKLGIDNWRWAGVPFYLRTGKRLKRRTTEIAIRFRQPPFMLFRETEVERLSPNWMVLRIQPDEGIALEFAAKRPGPSMSLGNVRMDFAYKSYFNVSSSTGYETLLYDCMIGDPTLFQRADTVEAGWQAVQPIIDAWANNPPKDFPNYAAGSNGPAAADQLLVGAERAWRSLD
jgi:glucose-6-phosphate 1-dehydrogenase